jgi:hypothetical protein
VSNAHKYEKAMAVEEIARLLELVDKLSYTLKISLIEGILSSIKVYSEGYRKEAYNYEIQGINYFLPMNSGYVLILKTTAEMRQSNNIQSLSAVNEVSEYLLTRSVHVRMAVLYNLLRSFGGAESILVSQEEETIKFSIKCIGNVEITAWVDKAGELIEQKQKTQKTVARKRAADLARQETAVYKAEYFNKVASFNPTPQQMEETAKLMEEKHGINIRIRKPITPWFFDFIWKALLTLVVIFLVMLLFIAR